MTPGFTGRLVVCWIFQTLHNDKSVDWFTKVPKRRERERERIIEIVSSKIRCVKTLLINSVIKDEREADGLQLFWTCFMVLIKLVTLVIVAARCCSLALCVCVCLWHPLVFTNEYLWHVYTEELPLQSKQSDGHTRYIEHTHTHVCLKEQFTQWFLKLTTYVSSHSATVWLQETHMDKFLETFMVHLNSFWSFPIHCYWMWLVRSLKCSVIYGFGTYGSMFLPLNKK